MQSLSSVKKVPEGYHSVTPFLIVEGASKLIQFLKQTFEAKVEESVNAPHGRIAHVEDVSPEELERRIKARSQPMTV